VLLALPFGARANSTVTSSIGASFNAGSVPAGDWLWFSAVFTVQNAPSTAFDIFVESGQIIGLGGNTYNTPKATIVFDPADPTTTETYASNIWQNQTKTGLSGNYFLVGTAVQAPAGGFAGSMSPTWTLQLATNAAGVAAGVSIQWQWAAALYSSSFPGANLASVGAKPTDDNSGSIYKNNDHAGTPESALAYFLGNAGTGGGGSNYTGSYTSTASSGVLPLNIAPSGVPAPSTLMLFLIGTVLVLLARISLHPSQSKADESQS
jgi:hypothetical protein